MEYSTQQKGAVAELMVTTRALSKGFRISKPVHDCRYDLVLDDGKTLSRVQVKWCSRADKTGALRVHLKKPHHKTYTASEADLIIVYVWDVGDYFVFTPEQFAGKQCLQLRMTPPRNNQTKGILLAADCRW
jgi:hypothetical protein